MREINYNQESMTVLFGEGKDLTKRHFKEIGHYQDIALEIDEENYLALEKGKALVCFTAREKGELIGYCVFLVKNNIRYKSSKQAIQDIIYVAPEKRGFGMKFIAWCDSELRKMGVQVVYHHTKHTANFGPGLERMGYELIDLIYGKRLDREV